MMRLQALKREGSKENKDPRNKLRAIDFSITRLEHMVESVPQRTTRVPATLPLPNVRHHKIGGLSRQTPNICNWKTVTRIYNWKQVTLA